MTNRWIGLIFASLLTILFLQSASAVAADAAYILKDGTPLSGSVIQVFNELDLTYDVVRNSQIASTNFSSYHFVVVGEDVSNSELIPFNNLSSVFFNKETAQDAWNIGSNIGSSSNSKVRAVNLTSFVYDNVDIDLATNDVQVYTTSHGVDYIKSPTPSGIVNVGIYPGDNTRKIISYSSTVVNGKVIKKLLFGAPETDYWNANGQQIFENSLVWVLQGLDQDSDGYLYSNDCNDNDDTIHPNATEVPYDGVDQDCNGIDLTDVDEDGYDSDVVGGLDCDDEDANVNPDNSDPLLNCVNDVPTINSINSITVSETEDVVIEVEANDPDFDDLTYSINDARFEVDGNLLTWHTDANDHGIYNFVVSASDDDLNASTIAHVVVTNINVPPTLLQPIPDLTWEEDGSASINLADYFSDEDGNTIFYGVHDTSSNSDITVSLNPNTGVVNFDSDENWFGSDWIQFYATDLVSNRTVSNIVTLEVLPVNDPVTFSGNIPDLDWNEDHYLVEIIDLNNYFDDPDTELNFEVFGNANVDVEIVDGIVSLHPTHDFFGTEEIYFRAIDEDSDATSNTITLTVNEQGEPPEFLELDCDMNLTEDVSETCTLEAWDLENNTFEFSVGEENNLNCDISGNELTYASSENYFGNASCELIVSDENGETSAILNVDISPINDAPFVESYSPNEDVATIIEGFSKAFSVEFDDVDSDDLNIKWYLDGNLTLQENGFDSDYLFEQAPGSYVLDAVASDGELEANRTWNVVVGPLGDFTCSEVGGHILEESQTCDGNLLGVQDSDVCCSLPGVPSFSDADACEIKDSRIILEITDPDESDDIELGDILKVKVDVENNYEEDQDFNVEAHLYDIENDESVSSVDADVEVNDGSSESVSMNLEIPEDLDLEDGDFALFVKADDDICYQTYNMLDIQRPDNKINVEDVDVPVLVYCGEQTPAEIEVTNFGAKRQKVEVRMENAELDIDEVSEEFYLDKYDGEDDSKKIDFSLFIPADTKSGKYEIDVAVNSDSKRETVKKQIEVSCEEEKPEQNNDDSKVLDTKLTLNDVKKLDGETAKNVGEVKKPNYALISIMLVIELILIVGLTTVMATRKKKSK